MSARNSSGGQSAAFVEANKIPPAFTKKEAKARLKEIKRLLLAI